MSAHLPEGMVSADEFVADALVDVLRNSPADMLLGNIGVTLARNLSARDNLWLARVRALEAERDEHATDHRNGLAAYVRVELALAASQANERELREAAAKWAGHAESCEAMQVAASSGLRMSTPCTCGWRAMDDLLSRPSGDTSALREFGIKVAEYALDAGARSVAADHGADCYIIKPSEAAAIVTRLLGDERKEGV